MVQLMHSFVGHDIPENILALVRAGKVGAFCLFGGLNTDTPAQVRRLTDSLRDAAKAGGHPPPLIGIDQEGGQLIAITNGATELPGNMALGATRSPDLADQAGRVLARELLAMGINMNFAPSLDVNFNARNPVVGVRSFGDDPQLVADLGVAMIRGMQREGVIATAKHFPGHGDTVADSHHTLPTIQYDMARLNEVELKPFRAAVQANVSAVMSAHILFPALDPEFPATISTKILRGILREQMGFAGLIVTDAMDMAAVNQLGTVASIEAAIAAGADLVLLGHLPEQPQLTARFENKLDAASLLRIAQVRRALPEMPETLPDLDVVGCSDHQAVARAIAECSITVVRDRRRQLPLRLTPEETLGLIHVQPTNLTPADTSSSVEIHLPALLRQFHAKTIVCPLPYASTTEEVQVALDRVADSDVVLVATIQATADPMQAALVRALLHRGQKPIVIALRMPYDIMAFPEVDAYLCTYSIRPVSMEACARVLFGEIEATGVLPCRIPLLT